MSFGKYRNQKRNEYKLLLNMHSSPLPTLVTPEELAQAEVIDRELNKETSEQQPKFTNRQAQYEEVLRLNAQLTNERSMLEEELNSYKATIQAQQKQISELKSRLEHARDAFASDNIASESNQLLSLRGELQNKLEMLSSGELERQRMLETQIRMDFKVQLAELESDCKYLEEQRDQLVSNPQKVEEVLEQKQFLKQRAEELERENFALKEENSMLSHKVSEFRAAVDDVTTKHAQLQRKLVDYESKIKLYEEMLEIHLLPDVDLEPKRDSSADALARSPAQAVTRARQLEEENERLQAALSTAHKETLSAQRSRLKLLETPQPVKQLLLDILQQINAEIAESTIGRREREERLVGTARELGNQDPEAAEAMISSANKQFVGEELDELRIAQRERILRKLLENKRIVEMTISALDVEQSLLLSGNADVLSWVKTGVIE